MKLIKKYQKALNAIYKHVGFKEDWVVYPIDNRTDYFWKIAGVNPFDQRVIYHEDKDIAEKADGNHYEDEIYTQRFYEKWVYEGKDFTMIFCDPHVDGMKYFGVYDNSKKLKK